MSRALLVIDVQREYFEGAFPIRHPVGHLGTILEVMDAAKKASISSCAITSPIRNHPCSAREAICGNGMTK
jgi:nicotinamidase-related amidase